MEQKKNAPTNLESREVTSCKKATLDVNVRTAQKWERDSRVADPPLIQVFVDA